MKVYGIPPCNLIGQLKDAVKEAILEGAVANNFEDADLYMRKIAPEMGLKAVDDE